MKIFSILNKPILIFTLIFSTSSQAQSYVVYAYLRTQEIIRVFSIVQMERSPVTKKLTALFRPIDKSGDHSVNALKITPDVKIPVILELSGGVHRPLFRHGMQLNAPVLTEYIKHGNDSRVFRSNDCEPSLKSQRENILSMLGIGFDVDGSYPGGPPQAKNLLGLHSKDYPHVDLSVPINQLNPEKMLQSQMQVLFPLGQQEHAPPAELQFEEGNLMAYFTNQGNIYDFTLQYIPDFKSFVSMFKGAYYIMMTPVNMFESLTRS